MAEGRRGGGGGGGGGGDEVGGGEVDEVVMGEGVGGEGGEQEGLAGLLGTPEEEGGGLNAEGLQEGGAKRGGRGG